MDKGWNARRKKINTVLSSLAWNCHSELVRKNIAIEWWKKPNKTFIENHFNQIVDLISLLWPNPPIERMILL